MRACGGVAFIDEIGDAPPAIQAKLLKYLDDFLVLPVGGRRPVFAPAYVIAATNADLEGKVLAAQFRGDLLERFRHRLTVPSLSERRGDLDVLVDFILQDDQTNPRSGAGGGKVARQVTGISRATLERLRAMPFPGNFRELERVLERAVQSAWMSHRATILVRDLSK
jgi:transcriptional regulator with GAF, ATPase, and Fis domain